MNPATVALFVRPPVPGRVKTRLAATIGDRFSCTLYRAMVLDVLRAVQASGLELRLFHDGSDSQQLPPAWRRAAAAVRPQVDGDLGARMAAAFVDCFAAGCDRVLLAAPFFIRLGGFDERLPFLEDQRIAARIRACGRWLTLPGRLHTSARRFESEGFHRRYLLMGLIMAMHSLGREEFFARSPQVYRVQRETGRLLLSPYFRLLRSLARHHGGLRETGATVLRLGGYLRANLWQLFFFCDVLLHPLLGPGRYPLLGLHDRLRARLPARDRAVWIPLDALLGLGCVLVLLAVLAPWFRLVDGRTDGDQP